LKSIFGSAVYGTILLLLCPLIEFAKHYLSICKVTPLRTHIFVVIFGKFECGIGREPGLGNICEFGLYWGILGSARRKRDQVKSEGRKVEDEVLRLVAHAEVSKRRVDL
jgi:hypothetical protein